MPSSSSPSSCCRPCSVAFASSLLGSSYAFDSSPSAPFLPRQAPQLRLSPSMVAAVVVAPVAAVANKVSKTFKKRFNRLTVIVLAHTSYHRRRHVFIPHTATGGGIGGMTAPGPLDFLSRRRTTRMKQPHVDTPQPHLRPPAFWLFAPPDSDLRRRQRV